MSSNSSGSPVERRAARLARIQFAHRSRRNNTACAHARKMKVTRTRPVASRCKLLQLKHVFSHELLLRTRAMCRCRAAAAARTCTIVQPASTVGPQPWEAEASAPPSREQGLRPARPATTGSRPAYLHLLIGNNAPQCIAILFVPVLMWRFKNPTVFEIFPPNTIRRQSIELQQRPAALP